MTVWVEWVSSAHGSVDLHIEPVAFNAPKDTLTFHSFQSIVIALGGEDQVPSSPVDSSHGTFVVAISLYAAGYDVHMYDEDVVDGTGSGAAYDEVVRAVQARGVDVVGIFGYSHGG